jgi:hypothetical protein
MRGRSTQYRRRRRRERRRMSIQGRRTILRGGGRCGSCCCLSSYDREYCERRRGMAAFRELGKRVIIIICSVNLFCLFPSVQLKSGGRCFWLRYIGVVGEGMVVLSLIGSSVIEVRVQPVRRQYQFLTSERFNEGSWIMLLRFTSPKRAF